MRAVPERPGRTKPTSRLAKSIVTWSKCAEDVHAEQDRRLVGQPELMERVNVGERHRHVAQPDAADRGATDLRCGRR